MTKLPENLPRRSLIVLNCRSKCFRIYLILAPQPVFLTFWKIFITSTLKSTCEQRIFAKIKLFQKFMGNRKRPQKEISYKNFRFLMHKLKNRKRFSQFSDQKKQWIYEQFTWKYIFHDNTFSGLKQLSYHDFFIIDLGMLAILF